MGSLNQNCIGVEHSGELVTFNSKRIEPLKSLKVYFSPVQEGEGDPSPENVRNIVGREGVEVYHTGKNLCDVATGTEMRSKWTISSGSSAFRYKTLGKFPIDQSFTLSCNVLESFGSTSNRRLYIRGKTQTFINTGAIVGKGSKTSLANPSDGTIIVFHNNKGLTDSAEYAAAITEIQLELGSTATEFEPYKGETISVDWSDEHGTIYGGYVDLVSGELVAELVTVHARDLSWGNYSNFKIFYVESKGWRSAESRDISNKLVPHIGYGWDSAPDNSVISGISGLMFIKHLGVSNINEFKAWLNEVDPIICYRPLAPVTYQLTSHQTQTLIGTNNIWSNADSVTAETFYIEPVQQTYKKFFYNEPHIVSASGDLITFDTDMKAPLKECKIEFSPIQLGEGDPSPENVREIQGWDGLNLYDLGSNNIFNWNVEQSYCSNTSSYSDVKRLFVPNTYIIGMSSTNYYRNNYSNWVINPSVSDSVVSFESGGATGYGIAFAFRLKEGETYSCSLSGNGNVHFAYYAEDGSYLGSKDIKNKSATIPIGTVTTLLCFLANDINTSFTFSNIQLEIGSTPTQYSDFDGTSNFVSWKDSCGIIYGGYLDLVNREVVAEWITNKIATMGWHNYSVKIRYYANVRLQDTVEYDREKNSYIYSDTLTPRSDGQFGKADVGYLTYYGTETTTGSNYNSVWTTLPEPMERDEARQWIAETYPDATICYKLATPIHYPLTPQILKTLKGTNNIWSSANGDLSIKYYKH